MSLLVTSCTMGEQPDRLLNKGPDYLRTRTNHGIFSSENRKSAVELLAASKAQFYTIRDRTILDRGQDLAVTGGQHNRYSRQKHQRSRTAPLTSRSKSEHNLSRLQVDEHAEDEDAQKDIDSDLNNNNSSKVHNSAKDKSDPVTETIALVEGTRNLSLETPPANKSLGGACANSHTANSGGLKALDSEQAEETSSALLRKTVITSVSPAAGTDNSLNSNKGAKTKPQPGLRKLKEKPIPPPRRSPRVLAQQRSEQKLQNTVDFHPHTGTLTQISPDQSTQNVALESKSSLTSKTCADHQPQSTNHSNLAPLFRSTARLNIPAPAQTIGVTPVTKPKIPPRPRKLDAALQRSDTCKQELTTPSDCVDSAGDINDRRKNSLVETLTKRFTSLSACKPPSETNREEGNTNGTSEKPPHFFKATPVFISKSASSQSATAFKTTLILNSSVATNSEAHKLNESNKAVIPEGNASRTCRKRCPDIEHSNDSYSKRERRSVASGKVRKPKLPLGVKNSEDFAQRDKSVKEICSPLSTIKSEMSIESAEQAVSESEINAVPLATMESEKDQSCGGDELSEGQEITRRNSLRSGRLDPGDASQSSGGSNQRQSSGGYSSSVPRSHSDISFRLSSGSGLGGVMGDAQGGQHSRDSSIVSSHSRLSRASVGADLENFFNQMGLEMGVLEPLARLRELQCSSSTGGERAPAGDASTYGSMSSLDSQDAASICSTYSRSEQECVGPGGLCLGTSGGAEGTPLAMGHHQQTSIVERNARIIKWLCNVRKAIKGGQSKADGGGSSSSTATGKA